MDIFKPKIRLRFVLNKTNKQIMICKYYCPSCGEELRLGQAICKCGLPMVWEGIKEWDDSQEARRKKHERTI